jgi:hypothetical protein
VRRRAPTTAIDTERIQSGVRLERRLLKVLKALAEYLDLSLSELIELIALQSFEGGPGFSKGTRRRIEELKRVYEMAYGLEDIQMRLFTDRR